MADVKKITSSLAVAEPAGTCCGWLNKVALSACNSAAPKVEQASTNLIAGASLERGVYAASTSNSGSAPGVDPHPREPTTLKPTLADRRRSSASLIAPRQKSSKNARSPNKSSQVHDLKNLKPNVGLAAICFCNQAWLARNQAPNPPKSSQLKADKP